MISETERIVATIFNAMFYGSDHTWNRGMIKWLGVPIYQNPCDMVMFQEVIWNTEPTIIIETGSCYGGGAWFCASILEKMNKKARVISIDSQIDFKPQCKHPQITFFKGLSCDEKTIKYVKSQIKTADRVMVILDSDHSMKSVLAEMNAYGDMVTPDCFMVVCDTNLGGNPIVLLDVPKTEKGPHGAVEKYLKTHKEFVIDLGRERFYLTFFPDGWLKKVMK